MSNRANYYKYGGSQSASRRPSVNPGNPNAGIIGGEINEDEKGEVQVSPYSVKHPVLDRIFNKGAGLGRASEMNFAVQQQLLQDKLARRTSKDTTSHEAKVEILKKFGLLPTDANFADYDTKTRSALLNAAEAIAKAQESTSTKQAETTASPEGQQAIGASTMADLSRPAIEGQQRSIVRVAPDETIQFKPGGNITAPSIYGHGSSTKESIEMVGGIPDTDPESPTYNQMLFGQPKVTREQIPGGFRSTVGKYNPSAGGDSTGANVMPKPDVGVTSRIPGVSLNPWANDPVDSNRPTGTGIMPVLPPNITDAPPTQPMTAPRPSPTGVMQNQATGMGSAQAFLRELYRIMLSSNRDPNIRSNALQQAGFPVQ